ncbi:MAG: translation elongation factor Ts [bacterium]
MEISAALVKELREKTGAGILDCKEALAATRGSLQEAVEHLRKKGLADAKKRAGRATSEGLIGSYIHSNSKIGVLVEVNCETDFVARTDQFKELCRNLSMQVAASSPRFLNADEIPPEVAEKEKEILRAQARESGKPDAVIEKMVEGRFKKFITDNCLFDQPYVKDPQMTVRQLVESVIAILGENVQVRRFVRFQLGEEL